MYSEIYSYSFSYYFKREPLFKFNIQTDKGGFYLQFTNVGYIDDFISQIQSIILYEYEDGSSILSSVKSGSLQFLPEGQVNPLIHKYSYLNQMLLVLGYEVILDKLLNFKGFIDKNRNLFNSMLRLSNKMDCIEYNIECTYYEESYLEKHKTTLFRKHSINILINSFTGASLLIDFCNKNMLNSILEVINNQKEKYEINIQDLGIWNATIDVQSQKSYYYSVLDDDKDFYKDSLEVIFEIETLVLYELLSIYMEFMEMNIT